MLVDIDALIAEATSLHNDGIALESYRAQLLEIRDRINRALDKLSAPQGSRRFCSWCQASNPFTTKYCPTCGHRADLPRACCDCPQCAPSLCTRPGGAGR